MKSLQVTRGARMTPRSPLAGRGGRTATCQRILNPARQNGLRGGYLPCHGARRKHARYRMCGISVVAQAGHRATNAENTDTPFKKIMAANRGEIAVRITRAGLELGLQTLAVYSEADRLQPHRFKADESYQVGSKDMTPVQCYLDYVGIVKLAKKQGVDVIHPGYGFLSENANFARECAENGITFVGPLPETIDAMGDKTAARKMAEACEVPVVQGTNE